MRTTLAVDSRIRDDLVRLKDDWGLGSLEAVLERLLAGPPKTAQQLYTERRRSVDRILDRYGVRRLIAFGSRARGDARPTSDLDLALEFPPKASLIEVGKCQEELCREFRMPVHVAALPVAGRLAQAIARDGVVLRA